MREIFDVLLTSAEALPAVTTEDALRLYRTQFILAAQSPADCIAGGSEECGEVSIINHLRAVVAIKEFLVGVVDEATGAAADTIQHVSQAVKTLNGFSAVKRVCAWATRVYKHQTSEMIVNENFVIEKSSRGRPTAGLFDVGEARLKLQAVETAFRDRRSKALALVFACALLHDAEASNEVMEALQRATAASVADGLTAYRTEVEAPLLQLLMERERRALLTSSQAAPAGAPLEDRLRLYEQRLAFATATLHPTSVDPVLKVSASIIFPTAVDLAAAFTVFLTAESIATAKGRQLLSGLLVPGRESEWLGAAPQLAASVLASNSSGSPDMLIDEAVACLQLGVDQRLIHKGVLQLTTPAGDGGAQRSVLAVATAQPACAASDGASNRASVVPPLDELIARAVDRYVRLGTIADRGPGFLKLVQLVKKDLDIDAVLTFAVDLQLRRLIASATLDSDEADAVALLQKAFGFSRSAMLRQLQLDNRESCEIAALVQRVFAVPGVALQPVLSFHCFTQHYALSLRFTRDYELFEAVPLPKGLQNMAFQVEAIYHDKFPRRRMTIMQHLSFATVRWNHHHGFTTVVLLPAHLLMLEYFGEQGVPLTVVSLLGLCPPGIAREQVELCLADLTAAGVLRHDSDTETYELNFTKAALHKKLVVTPRAGKRRAVDPQGAANSTHRRFLIESAVMTELKQTSPSSIDDIYRRCASRLTSRVPGLSAKDFKSAVSRLCQLEYAELTNPTTLRYVA